MKIQCERCLSTLTITAARVRNTGGTQVMIRVEPCQKCINEYVAASHTQGYEEGAEAQSGSGR